MVVPELRLIVLRPVQRVADLEAGPEALEAVHLVHVPLLPVALSTALLLHEHGW